MSQMHYGESGSLLSAERGVAAVHAHACSHTDTHTHTGGGWVVIKRQNGENGAAIKHNES